MSRFIKATRPFKRLSIDFKGPIPPMYVYMLNAIEKYLRFPFAFSVKDMTSAIVKKCLSNLFVIQTRTSLISREMKK